MKPPEKPKPHPLAHKYSGWVPPEIVESVPVEPAPQDEAPKRRGRPPKLKTEDTPDEQQ